MKLTHPPTINQYGGFPVETIVISRGFSICYQLGIAVVLGDGSTGSFEYSMIQRRFLFFERK